MRTAGWILPASLWIGLGCGSSETGTPTERLAALDAMIVDTRRTFPDVEGISVDEVKRLHEAGAVVFIDARPAVERLVSTLPGAITPEEFEEDPGRFVGRTPVAYCTIGYRSAQLVRRLSDRGHRVLNFEGSIVAWTHVGGALDGPEGPTQRVHVYGDRWNLLADGYEAIW